MTVSEDPDEEYVPRRDTALLVRFVVLFVLALVCVAVGFQWLAGFRVGRFVAQGFGTVTDPGSDGATDGGTTPPSSEVPEAAPVE